MARVFVTSCYKNQYYAEVVTKLKEVCHEVFDYRNLPNSVSDISLNEIDENTLNWSDSDVSNWADTYVLVLPCFRAPHIEAGVMAGAGKK